MVDGIGSRSVNPWSATGRHRDWWLLVGLPAVAMAFVLAWPRAGWWALGAGAMVYGCGYLAFSRHRAWRRTTAEVAHTLGRLAELNGASRPGHTDRSSIVAVAVGRRLGMDDAALEIVGHTARAGDVGRVGLDRSPTTRPGFDRETVAEWSAAIMRRAPGLAEAADAVVPPDPEDPYLRSVRRVVQVATAFDEATSGEGLAADEALALVAASAPDHSDEALATLGAIFGVVRR
ncbi:MAG: hypothetical protein ACR2JP_02605 [Acidimicrobiia bacterium]